ncbi:hypothetical protein H3146_06975 [Streptomyces sp. OF3]|uniref:Uncharacterized protein n=1 Tax=Streptomyces alkaliterrae TaxID=2213162 RepID=A0A7W3WIR4_9ACTN|nr:hypothetical protein [Streptomyces alkaliterrae]MBB1253113.1 hypothetical protein [Streptomyces alkaliterrae]
MHVSGGLLLLTFLIPPVWLLDAVGAVSPDNPSADWPSFLLPLVLLFSIAVFHALVQIPAGLVGSWLMARRSALTGYLGALMLAAILAVPTLVFVMGTGTGRDALIMWADYTGRCALSLTVYLWFIRARERRRAEIGASRRVLLYRPAAGRYYRDHMFPTRPRRWQ